jgi:hypothetical protein
VHTLDSNGTARSQSPDINTILETMNKMSLENVNSKQFHQIFNDMALSDLEKQRQQLNNLNEKIQKIKQNSQLPSKNLMAGSINLKSGA